ncbi:MAG: T9SS type A sorting domain-containing protein [Chitinophagales bacterium]|nr:T9SS type A sorting domain-containing protein [Chitinophagaceae bacterium]MCB9065590.1 T9SS type A sorting domain-containing protein [Chitinophagales bacterium]
MKYRIFTATFLFFCLIATVSEAQIRLAGYTHSEYTSVGNKFWVKDSIKYDCYKNTNSTEGKFPIPEYEILYTNAQVFAASSSTAALTLQERHTQSFDGSNHLTERIVETPDGSGWKNKSKIEITYVSGMPDSVFGYTWSTFGAGSWRQGSRVGYKWSGNNVLTYTRETRGFGGGGGSNWKFDHRMTYTYNGSNETSRIREEYSGGNWVNKLKVVTTYSGGKKTEELTQDWDGSQWTDKEKTLFTFDASNRVTKEETSFYDAIQTKWFNSYLNTYTYSGSNKVADSMIRQNWDGLQNIWVNNIRFIHESRSDKMSYQETSSFDGNMWIKTQGIDSANKWYWDYPVGVNEIATASDDEVKVYPSPANDVLNINIANSTADFKLAIVDMTGRVQKSWTANAASSISVSVSSLPAGNYVLAMDDGNGIKTKQFVINR